MKVDVNNIKVNAFMLEAGVFIIKVDKYKVKVNVFK